ncbi:hypothetical protein PTNB85_00356 [Pyrenophora teres f. teres]|nr:hypothetical protein PTNB85_00356 [Pyrenophora teres f. teres]
MQTSDPRMKIVAQTIPMPMGNHNTKIKQLYRAILPCAPDINKFWELVWFVDQYWYTGFSRSSDTTDDVRPNDAGDIKVADI